MQEFEGWMNLSPPLNSEFDEKLSHCQLVSDCPLFVDSNNFCFSFLSESVRGRALCEGAQRAETLHILGGPARPYSAVSGALQLTTLIQPISSEVI